MTYTLFKFKACKSVPHHTIQINHQPDAATSQDYYLSFKYSSTFFGHPHAHHQELNNCSSSLWFYLRNMVTALLPPSPSGKLEAASAVIELLMMGMRMPKTC
jgi:hypothetical protein